MKFTLSWLKEHFDTDATADSIAEALTSLGLEVESVEDKSMALKPFIVAEILQTEKHPQADKLQVCRVFDGKAERQVVCGAPNARAGIKVVLATEGVTIPNGGMKIKKSSIRGVESNGMLCSAEELNLNMVGDGIIELPADAKPGTSVVDALGLNDPLFDIAITPNRGDALGVHGIARDLAAKGIGTLKKLQHTEIVGSFDSPVNVKIDNSVACPLFVGCFIKNVRNGESPEWLKRRLQSVGQKSISALVDITNFLTHDVGRPLHVYDAAKLKGNLRVRSARKGESLQALNDKTYPLEEGMTVIADDSGPLSLGGIIGGKDSAVSEATTEIFLEAALFDPLTIAETGRKLQIDSDARYRFERGVDPTFVMAGMELAVALIQTWCGGEASRPLVVGEAPDTWRAILFRPERVKTLGGADVPAKRISAILDALGFNHAPGRDHTIEVIPPSWRPDIEGEADIVEEILRVHGYDQIQATLLPKPLSVAPPVLSPLQRRIGKARRLLAARGLAETITYAFIPDAAAQLFGARRQAMQLMNPISTELSTMRPSLLPNLVVAAAKNAARGVTSLSLFEIGRQFDDVSPAAQKRVIAGIRAGRNEERSHYKNEREVDAMDAKSDAFALLQGLGIDTSKLQTEANAPAWYHPGRSSAITLGGKTILGFFGELHPTVCKAMDIKLPIAAFEIFVESLPEPRNKNTSRPSLTVSDYQAVERDFAFLMGESMPVATLLKTIEKAGRDRIASVTLFDLYSGPKLEEGKKSVALCVRLEPKDRTLTEEDIEAVMKDIIAAAEGVGATLRQ